MHAFTALLLIGIILIVALALLLYAFRPRDPRSLAEQAAELAREHAPPRAAWPDPPARAPIGPPLGLLLALLAVWMAAPGCVAAGGHYVYTPPNPIACAAAVALASAAQLPCDHKRPDPVACASAVLSALADLVPCAPTPVWVADPPPRPDGGSPAPASSLQPSTP